VNRTKLAALFAPIVVLCQLLEQYPCFADDPPQPARAVLPAMAPTREAPRAHDEAVDGWYLAGGIVTIAAGLGLGVAGVYAALRRDAITSDAGYQRFSEGVPPSIDTCNAARNGVANQHYRLLSGAAFPSEMAAKCDEIDTLIAVEVISFPMSLVLAGLGSFLIVEAFGVGFGESASITPTISPGYAGVSGRF
jgi:hypothetical protein